MTISNGSLGIAAGLAAVFVLAMTPARAQQAIPVFPRNNTFAAPCAPGQQCAVQSPQFGLRCQTPTFWCGIPEPAPIGLACSCRTPRGAVSGQVAR